MTQQWRDRCRPIISKVIAEHKGKPTLKQALHDAYPFGQRAYHPYKIWLSEIRRQMGTEKPKNLKGLKKHAAQVID